MGWLALFRLVGSRGEDSRRDAYPVCSSRTGFTKQAWFAKAHPGEALLGDCCGPSRRRRRCRERFFDGRPDCARRFVSTGVGAPGTYPDRSQPGTAGAATGFAAGAVDFINRPFAASVVRSRIVTHLALVRADKLRLVHQQVVRCLGIAAEYKDNESGLHIIRVSQYARPLAEALGWSDERVEDLMSAVPLHDVGKIGIPDVILQKPGRLSADEMAVMQQHAEIGARIIGQHQDGMLAMAARIALSHHEKWNGSGYPQGLAGDDIPIPARLMALAAKEGF